jgi:hypothetical protein
MIKQKIWPEEFLAFLPQGKVLKSCKEAFYELCEAPKKAE